MWTLLLLLIASAAASDEEDYNLPCGVMAYRQCEENNAPEEFPGTEEEYEEFCKLSVKLFECIGTTVDQCPDEEKDDFPSYAREMLSTVHRVCDNDTLLFSAIIDNLPCFKKDIHNIGYYPVFDEERQKTFSEALASHGLTDLLPDDAEPYRCLLVLYEVSYVASEAGRKCGDVAKDVVMDIALGYESPFTKCRPGVKEKLPTIVRVMELLKEKEEEEYLTEKKK